MNPMIDLDGKKVLVECYRLLRQNDMLGKNKTAYRITVRQLESLIRLSEALARLHLDDKVLYGPLLMVLHCRSELLRMNRSDQRTFERRTACCSRALFLWIWKMLSWTTMR